jgi:hypothetical protein
MEAPNRLDEPSFARGEPAPLGAYTEPVKTFLDAPTHALWLRLCNEKDRVSSQLLREIIYLLVHGKTPAEMSADDTRELLANTGPFAGLSRLEVRR